MGPAPTPGGGLTVRVRLPAATPATTPSADEVAVTSDLPDVFL